MRRTEVEVDETAGTTSGASYGTTGHTTGTSATGASLGDKVAGLVKEGAGKVTGNEDLERRGEAPQGKTSTGY